MQHKSCVTASDGVFHGEKTQRTDTQIFGASGRNRPKAEAGKKYLNIVS